MSYWSSRDLRGLCSDRENEEPRVTKNSHTLAGCSSVDVRPLLRAHNLLIQHSVYWQWLTAGTWATSDSDSAAAGIHWRQKFAQHFLIFISVFNQLDAQNLFQNKFYFMPLHVSSTRTHHQEVKIALHSLWYRLYVWRYQRLCNAILTSWW